MAFHPSNRHHGHYPMESLVESFPKLKKYVRQKTEGLNWIIDFSDPRAVQSLNSALLLHYYKIREWNLPDNYLCPAIPGRVDYLHYIDDLLQATALTSENKYTILDIGTGANGIYALLAASGFEWNVIATDISKSALTHLQGILKQNPTIGQNVELRHQPNPAHILKGIGIENSQSPIAATVCNPPFYENSTEAQNAHLKKHKTHLKRNLPSNSSTRTMQGNLNELCYPGGERAFIETMITESALFRNKITWYTTLVSQQSTLGFAQAKLLELKVANFRIIPMKHGNKTTRILAWSYDRPD